MENQGRTTTPEGGRIGLLSSGGNEIKLYRRIVYTIHCPATIKAVKMCPRKDIEGAVGYVSLKPTVVAADCSRSAQGVARPYPYRADWQRHEWPPSRRWGGHKGGCVLLT